MRFYRFAWIVSAAVVMASAGVYDVVSGGWLRLALLGPLAALFGGLLGFALTEESSDRWKWTRRGVMWTGLGAVATDALVATWGGLGAFVGAMLVLTSPTLIRWTRAQFLSWSSKRAGGPPEALTRRDLLRRWNWTTVEVLRTSTPVATRLVLVEERRRLLDELELRDPEAFDEWVATAVPAHAGERTRGSGERSWKRGW